jgi:glycerate dehydrogenase
MKAVFLDFATMGPGLDLGPLRDVVDTLEVHEATSDAELPARIATADIVFTNKIRLTAQLLEGAPRLEFIGLTATGSDNIDLSAAREHGIAVANITGYCNSSVAEHVFGVLLMLTHRLPQYRESVRQGRWQESDMPFLLDHPVQELGACTLGIVGHGELGGSVARIATAFGMRVLIAERRNAGQIRRGRIGFDEMLETADVISLHCPLTDETRGLMAAAEFARMKNTAILVNTARGGLVDSAALADALRRGEIAAAAVDVLPSEPPVDGDPLLDYTGDNLIVTPHIAWATQVARQNAIDELAANTRAFLGGERRNRIA